MTDKKRMKKEGTGAQENGKRKRCFHEYFFPCCIIITPTPSVAGVANYENEVFFCTKITKKTLRKTRKKWYPISSLS